MRGVAGDFQFAHHAPGERLGSTVKPTPKKGKKSQGGDLFASTEADFFGFKKGTSALLSQRIECSSTVQVPSQR
jgi:hypothetical protein